MPWKLLTLILCLVVGQWAHAQLKNVNTAIDPDYIADFPEIASFRLYVAQRNFSFGLKSEIGDGKRIAYAPNVQGVYGLGLYYRKLGLELSFSLPSSNRENTLFGKTKFLDFQVNSYGKEIGYDFSFQSYKGFYQSNPKDFDAQWSVLTGYPQRPDISALKLGMNVYYIFNNERFSYQAAFNQTERQLRSAGSFLMSSSFSYVNIRSDSSLYPVPKPYAIKQSTALEDGRFNILGFAPGYVHTFVIHKDFYVSPSLFWGLAIRQQSYKMDDSRHSNFGIAQKVNFRLAAGYYGNRVFTGMTLVTDDYRMNLGNILLSTSTFNVRLFVGYRFSQILGKNIQSDKLDKLLSQGQ